MRLSILFVLLITQVVVGQNIGDFQSLVPTGQNTDLIIPSSHTFQKIISRDDPLSQGGNLPGYIDFTGYVPINNSNEKGYLSLNSETVPGGVSILDINFNTVTGLWSTSFSSKVDFSGVVGTIANCSGTVTPWNTIITCEEYTSQEIADQYPFPIDSNGDGYDDFGWAVEIDPVTKTVIDKRWALGNFKHENLVIHNNQRTAYQGADATVGYLFKFVADNQQDLGSGKLYVYRGSKNGSGEWVLLNNTTPEERNTTNEQSATVGATVFSGIEDVEIGPNGFIYFAVKNENRVYRFQDSDPVSGTTVINMETFVGNASYTIQHQNGNTNVNWGYGNDNMAFDNEGNLWVLQDGDNNYIWVVKNGHTQANPRVEIFGTTPAGSEPTGITFSPDNRFLFMSIQHPNSGNSSSTQTDAAGVEVSFDKDTAIVIALKENLGSSTEYTWYLDADGDGYAILPTVSSAISPGPGYTIEVLPTTDCNDSDPNVFEVSTWYLDADSDGYAVLPTIESCNSPGAGYTQNVLPTTDCDDTDPNVFEVSTWYLDADGDGYAVLPTVESCDSPGTGYTQNILPTTDCDDSDPNMFEVTTWYLDEDGDGYAVLPTVESCNSPGTGYTLNELPTTDCDNTDPNVFEVTTWYLDADGDGYAVLPTVESCNSPGAGYTQNVLPTTDCDDTDPNVFKVTTWYLDADGDGYAVLPTVESCNSPGTGYTLNELPTTDCDDTDSNVFEVTTWYLDADGDGYAVLPTLESCNSPGFGYTKIVLPTTDCDDTDPNVFEVTTWYLDADGDGYAVLPTVESCSSPGTSYTQNILPITDCDDTDPNVFEVSTWYLDGDGDGYAVQPTMESCNSPGLGYTKNILPTTDCDDSNPFINPETIWYLNLNESGIPDSEKIIMACKKPGEGYSNIDPATLSLETQVIVYPNPTTEAIEIDLVKVYPLVNLTIVNSNNQLVLKNTFDNKRIIEIELIQISSGIYFLYLNDQQGYISSKKIIKR
ncbi:DUF839 domain-containing protein [Maribacter sp. PR1]|uniref:Alkaline phosphatase PhoX n=1 Tax=Maribacter cobaltidurans TaxID=1178778 RepID=A0ABU7IYM0_9FLAO|nr:MULTISPECIES: alkaline phosphatase PhoX [Maribacter]MDC6390695.1 DUF839 domain-containing protein [Maribacter sp. PR1]MEE1978087.1 alkaline phosphatase PhoX [Maribacter cobaltidurans]